KEEWWEARRDPCSPGVMWSFTIGSDLKRTRRTRHAAMPPVCCFLDLARRLYGASLRTGGVRPPRRRLCERNCSLGRSGAMCGALRKGYALPRLGLFLSVYGAGECRMLAQITGSTPGRGGMLRRRRARDGSNRAAQRIDRVRLRSLRGRLPSVRYRQRSAWQELRGRL